MVKASTQDFAPNADGFQALRVSRAWCWCCQGFAAKAAVSQPCEKSRPGLCIDLSCGDRELHQPRIPQISFIMCAVIGQALVSFQ